MMDDLRRLILISISAGIIVAAAAIHSSGCDGSIAGYRIGPSKCWLVAGR